MSSIVKRNTVASVSQGSIIREPTILGWSMQRFIGFATKKTADTKKTDEQEPKKDYSFFQYTVETNAFLRNQTQLWQDDCVSCVSE